MQEEREESRQKLHTKEHEIESFKIIISVKQEKIRKLKRAIVDLEARLAQQPVSHSSSMLISAKPSLKHPQHESKYFHETSEIIVGQRRPDVQQHESKHFHEKSEILVGPRQSDNQQQESKYFHETSQVLVGPKRVESKYKY